MQDPFQKILSRLRSEKAYTSDGLLSVRTFFLIHQRPWLDIPRLFYFPFIMGAFCLFRINTNSVMKTVVLQIIDHIGIHHECKNRKNSRVDDLALIFKLYNRLTEGPGKSINE